MTTLRFSMQHALRSRVAGFDRWAAGTILGLAMLACNHTYRPVDVDQVKTETFFLDIHKVTAGDGATDYWVDMTVKNIGKETATFDSGDLTLTQEKSGLSYFSVVKDKETVTIPVHYGEVITRRTLEPGQATRGQVWFRTPSGQARSSPITISYQGHAMKFR